jgi:1,4-dihydroxy-2-naphthoate octaprenyltransferase
MAMNLSSQKLNIPLLILSLMAMLLLQAGANILNDIHDFKNGLDKTITPVSGGIIRGLITTRQAWVAVSILFLAGSSLGIFISLRSTLLVLTVGIPGVLIGWFYSHGRQHSLKFSSLGDASVFFGFGTLGALGSWMVQTRQFSWLPMIWSTPIALLIIAILHANNWRDRLNDAEGGVRTVANRLGDRGALRYYTFLIYSPFLIILLLMTLPHIWDQPAFPLTGAMTLLSLPLAISLSQKAQRRHNPAKPHDFVALDGSTAQLNLAFGGLCALAILIDHLAH